MNKPQKLRGLGQKVLSHAEHKCQLCGNLKCPYFLKIIKYVGKLDFHKDPYHEDNLNPAQKENIYRN